MKAIEVQLAPFGEYVCHDGSKENDGKKQIVDETAVDNLVASFDGEALVDIDHKSMYGESTEAAAWVKSLRKDSELGLMGTFELTTLGEEVLGGKRFKYVSPTWELDETGRPCKLISVGLTNTPNLPVRAAANSERAKTPLHFLANALHFSPSDFVAQGDASGADASEGRFSHDSEGGENPPANPHTSEENERKPEMEKLKEILGLPPEATEEDIAGAVTALKEEIDSFKAAKADAEAEEFANSCEQCEDKEALKNAYKANPELKQPGFNDTLSATVQYKGNTPEYKRLVSIFGDQITHENGEVKWRGSLIRDAFKSEKPFEIRLGKPTSDLLSKLDDSMKRMVKNKSFTVTDSWLRKEDDSEKHPGGHGYSHFEPYEKKIENIPLNDGDLDMLPTMWRNPDRVLPGAYDGSILLEIDTMDGGVLTAIVDITRVPFLKTYYKRKKTR